MAANSSRVLRQYAQVRRLPCMVVGRIRGSALITSSLLYMPPPILNKNPAEREPGGIFRRGL